MYKFFVIASVLACANAGLIGAPAVATYGAAYGAAPVAYGAAYGAAPVAYASHAAPLAYASHAAPLAYAAHSSPLAYAAAPAAITSQHSNILRSYGNLGQVSTYSKTIDTPYSSVRKSDVRVSNPGYATVAHSAPLAYAAPAAYASHAAYAAPAAYASHAAYAAPAAHGLLGVAYSAAPAVAHVSFDGLSSHYAW